MHRARNFIFLFALGGGHLWSISAAIDLPKKSVDEGKEYALRALKRLNTNCTEMDVTLGSAWRCKTSTWSIIGLDVFVSTIPEKTILRVDASTRASHAFIDIVAQDMGQGPYEKKYTEKSLILSTATTLISPSLGYLYVNYDTMMKSKSIWLKSMGLLFADLSLFWISSKVFFTNGFEPFEAGLVPMLITMGAYRLAALMPFSWQVIAHNRFVGLGVTFRF